MDEEKQIEEAPQVQPKWYFKNTTVVIAFLVVGPFMLPLVWLNPQYSSSRKVFLSFTILVLTALLLKFGIQSTNSISEYYQLLGESY